MRDTSDMMEDALSEDTMMNCGGDGGGLEDLVDLATDVADSSPTIRDAAERLLTLLGMDDENEDLLSSSEDEGVELDELEDEEDEEDEEENTRLLHQLAASLAAELKQSHQKQTTSSRLSRIPCDRKDLESSFLEHDCVEDQDVQEMSYHEELPEKWTCSSSSRDEQDFRESYEYLDHRLRMDEDLEELKDSRSLQGQVPAAWGAGWDACASEALRYLVEDEGLPLHHPTVLAMKDHLEMQRGRAFAQYTA